LRGEKNLDRIRALSFWQGDISVEPLGGGLTNINYVVEDSRAKYVVRLGEDIPHLHIMRFSELAASRAAHSAGISPEVVFAQDGLMVLDFIECHTLTSEDIRKPEVLQKIQPLIKLCHREIPNHLRGPILAFWPFQVIRDQSVILIEAGSQHANLVRELVAFSNALETDAAPFDIVFGHNDLLAANFLDDGSRMWLIDWDYAGFNTPLFDLGGLASNNDLSNDQERWLLEEYFETPITDEIVHRYEAMKCVSLLRETMWSMVSEINSSIKFDFAEYTSDYLTRFRAAHDAYRQT